MIWLPDRSRQQRLVVQALYADADEVACNRKAVFAGGLCGADKHQALSDAGVDRRAYLTLSIDGILDQLAIRGLIPHLEGLSPLERADLVHAEAQHIAKRLAALAVADGRNILLDVTMGSQPSVQSWLVTLGLAKYGVHVVFAYIDVEEALEWADARHRRGEEDYKRGVGMGGRYISPDSVIAAAPIVQSIAVSDWAAIMQHLREQESLAFPAGHVLAAAQEYSRGRIAFIDLIRQIQLHGLADIPPTCPPGLQDARSALDDLEPWVAGSFDEIELACDLGWLSDDDLSIIVTRLSK